MRDAINADRYGHDKNGTQEHTGSETDANATQEHTGSNKRKKTRDTIKRNNKGRDDLETN
jgi:hypothetical protein